jgi:hypothetical protein
VQSRHPSPRCSSQDAPAHRYALVVV